MKAREKAAVYLNARPRTKQQVIDYLRDKKYDDKEIFEAVEELEEYHFIDDLEYSRLFFELGFEKGRGAMRIRRELEQKGVDRATIDQAYSELENLPEERDMAEEIAYQVIRNINVDDMPYEDKQKLRAKIVRRLAGRGFSPDVCYSVAKQLIN